MGGLPDGRFCVLGGRNRLVRFNRAGIADPPVKLAGEFGLLATDAAGTVYLGHRRRSNILVLEEESARELQLPDDALPTSLAILGDRLVVLEGDTRVSIYRLP
jgi:high-affinity K+ transport system ATPase subunit B